MYLATGRPRSRPDLKNFYYDSHNFFSGARPICLESAWHLFLPHLSCLVKQDWFTPVS